MKEKDLGWIHMQEVMTAIQNYLEEEAQEEVALPEGMVGTGASLFQERVDNPANPVALHIVQYYLTRQGSADPQVLQSLPAEFFICC